MGHLGKFEEPAESTELAEFGRQVKSGAALVTLWIDSLPSKKLGKRVEQSGDSGLTFSKVGVAIEPAVVHKNIESHANPVTPH